MKLFLIADSENVKLCQKLEIFKVFTKFLLDWIRFQTLQEFTLQIPLFLTTFLVQTHDLHSAIPKSKNHSGRNDY